MSVAFVAVQVSQPEIVTVMAMFLISVACVEVLTLHVEAVLTLMLVILTPLQ
jgi:hypothetical protein